MAFLAENWRSTARRYLPWLLLVLFSLTLHLWGLGERSYHHDESIHAHASWVLLQEGTYRYDPTYHGPLLYYLTAIFLAVFGDSDFTARLSIALAGVALIGVAFAARRPLGPRAAWWTGLLATISPIWLYYGRFLRMDILEVFVASAAAVAAWRAVNGSWKAWMWFGVWVGLAFATKENAFVSSALVGVVALVLLIRAGPRSMVPNTVDWISRHRWGLIASVAAAVLVTVPMFTVGFTHLRDWFFPYKAISYWWGQHTIERVAGPPWYHLPRLAIYEFLPIVAALSWAVRRGRRMRLVEWSLLVFGLASIAMYSYLGEKVPWLGVHQVWAFLPLAGLQMARTFGPRGVWWSRTLAGIGLAATLVTTVTANFVLDEISPNLDRVEALVYVQTCPELLQPLAEGVVLAAEGHDPAAAAGGEVAWPATWYWRTTPVWWADPNPGQRQPLVFCDPSQEPEVRRRLGPGYSSERIPLRGWWVMADQRPTVAELIRYLFTRRPWGIIGSTDTVVLRYTGEVDEGARTVETPGSIAGTLGGDSSRVIGEGWLVEPRGISVNEDGLLAVADSAANDVLFFNPDGILAEIRVPDSLNQPESVAWTPDGLLVIADTWNHRVLIFNPATGAVRPMPLPVDGWFGPRGVAVAADGSVAVTDTGHKRIVMMTVVGGTPRVVTIGREGSGPGEFVEPVGLAWIDNRRLLVADTGNRRLQVLDRQGRALEIVDLPGAWSDFYSRPQLAIDRRGRWLVTDVPSQSIWLVESGEVTKIDLAEAGIVPTGLTDDGKELFVADLESRVWAFGDATAIADAASPSPE